MLGSLDVPSFGAVCSLVSKPAWLAAVDAVDVPGVCDWVPWLVLVVAADVSGDCCWNPLLAEVDTPLVFMASADVGAALALVSSVLGDPLVAAADAWLEFEAPGHSKPNACAALTLFFLLSRPWALPVCDLGSAAALCNNDTK